MEKTSVGNQLVEAFMSAQQELWLVAPFIKIDVLSQLLEKVKPSVIVKCFTRWRPEEIAAGVSDLEIWDVLKNRPHSVLCLRNNLHAKYYRADNQCFIGSANLTQAALGWSTRSNLELLVSIPSTNPLLHSLEKELTNTSIQVDDNLYQQMRLSVNHLLQIQSKILWRYPEQEIISSSIDVNYWTPTLRNPESLFLAYIGQRDRLTLASWEAAQRDLMALDLPRYLTKAAFKTYVGCLLLQMPVIQQVDEMLRLPQRFGSMVRLVESLVRTQDPDFNADRAWQTLMRWLRYFLPDRYRLSIPNYSEVLYRADFDIKNLRIIEEK